MKGIFKKAKQEVKEESPVANSLSETANNTASESQFSFNFFEEKDKSTNSSEQQQKKKKKKKKKASTNPSEKTRTVEEESVDEKEAKQRPNQEFKSTQEISSVTINSQIEQDLVLSLQATSLNQPSPPPTAQPIVSQEVKNEPTQPSKKKKNSNKKKKSKGKNDVEESEDDDMKFLDAIIEQQKQEALKQKQSKKQKQQPQSSSNTPSKLKSKNTKPIDNFKGPKFITTNSADVAKLDEQEKLKLKYGQGKNLVSVGPRKVKDPNWLGPPPGLAKVSDADLRVIRPPEEAQSSSLLTASNAMKANSSNSDIVYHHSPFTFSFTGL